MFLSKIFYFLKGYVIIEIDGTHRERFINSCINMGMQLRDISGGRAVMRRSDFLRIRPAARKAGVNVRVVKKCGLYHECVKNGGWFMLLSAAVFCLIFIISAQYVWSLSIEGCDEETAAEVAAVAESFGLREGVRKGALPDGNTMRDELIYNIDGINWAWVYLEGTHARIEVSENIPAPKIEDDNTPCNVTACREGLLRHVSAKGGRAVLDEGMHVEPGDIVISGAMPGGELTAPYEVAAKGDVFAETVHEKSCEYPLYKSYTRDTGEEFTRYGIRLFEVEIPLHGGNPPDFEEYRVEVKTPPLGICSYRYIGTQTVTEQLSYDTAVHEAREVLYERIAAELAPGSSRIDERVTVQNISKDRIKVTLTMSFIENIGVKTPVEQWQMEELTDDKTD